MSRLRGVKSNIRATSFPLRVLRQSKARCLCRRVVQLCRHRRQGRVEMEGKAQSRSILLAQHDPALATKPSNRSASKPKSKTKNAPTRASKVQSSNRRVHQPQLSELWCKPNRLRKQLIRYRKEPAIPLSYPRPFSSSKIPHCSPRSNSPNAKCKSRK